MEALLSDIRYGIRGLRRAPLFTASVALTIGIGLGILCSVFAVFNAYVLRPFPVHDPYSLYEFSKDTKTARREPFTWREYTQLHDQSDLRVKSYNHLNISRASVAQLRASLYVMRLNRTSE